MTERELRALVRESIARHLDSSAAGPAPLPDAKGHSSHGVFQLASGRETGGACLIEPAVRCTHCGYCQSFGH